MSDIVNVYHADGGVPARIAAQEEIPRILDAGKARTFYNQQGQLLADALWSALPGGTLDVLLARLMERRASMFRVPFQEPRPAARDSGPISYEQAHTMLVELGYTPEQAAKRLEELGPND